MQLTMELLLGLLAICQIITGVISWYFGMQVRLLRLELVNRHECTDRHANLTKEITELHTKLERVETITELQGLTHAKC